MQLTSQQQAVFDKIKEFLDSDASVFILKGYAGTGKTTMVKEVAEYVGKRFHLLLMAPTGRAARVLTEKVYGRDAQKSAMTIHKSIYGRSKVRAKEVSDIAEAKFKWHFPISVNEYGGKQVIIVDEASMVCSRTIKHELFVFGTDNLMEDLLTYARPAHEGKIIFVGDPAQLPPVGENVSNALNPEYFIGKGLKVMEAELTEVLRQKGDSLILKNAMKIRDVLNSYPRNNLVFEEQEGDVETVASDDFLGKYLVHRKESKKNDCVVICYSNRAASNYNLDIRRSLYGENKGIQKGDILLVTQNNYGLNRMNGEFVQVLEVGERVQQTAPVYVEEGGQNVRKTVTINFIRVTVPDSQNVPTSCLIIEDLLTSDRPSLTIDENRALYINFCIRHPHLKQNSQEFCDALITDPYYNALRVKYGYAVTGHKCQGGEWGKVFVDYSGRTGLSDDCLRWAYTATTRAQKTLYITNLPHITPFTKFRTDPIQKCSKFPPECRMLGALQKKSPFHSEAADGYLHAKWMCIDRLMQGTPFSIESVISQPYKEIYTIMTPMGLRRFDIMYKKGGVFLPAIPQVQDDTSRQVCMILDDEREMPIDFSYQPSDEIHRKLYYMIRSACDGLSIQLTNVVEHPEDYSVNFYMRTSSTYSYIKAYIDASGFVSYAKPMSLKGTDDQELKLLIDNIQTQFALNK